MKHLHIADDLWLPADEAATQKYAFIGRSGSGKTYGALKLAELLLKAEAQIIALDWVGNWYALRLATDGKSPGFPQVYIFGGDHGDVPLEATGGAMLADLLVEKHISAVLDLSPFRKAERTRFATAFAEQLFHRKKTARTPCHLFLEEAQAFLPQMVRGDDARMVGVFEDIGKVGRNYGIGVSVLTQRPQAVNKDVLNQTEVLLAFQTNGPQERKTIAGWIAEHGDEGRDLVDDLPKLPRGSAFLWSPQWLQVCKQIHIAGRETYDASSTPTNRAKRVKPLSLTPADLSALGEAMKATVEKAKADDPRELRKRIATLEQQLKAKAPVTKAEEKITVRQVLTDADRACLERLLVLFEKTVEVPRLEVKGEVWVDVVERLREALLVPLNEFHQHRLADQRSFLKAIETKGVQKILDKLSQIQPTPAVPRSPQTRRVAPAAPATSNGPARLVSRPPVFEADGQPTDPQRRILASLAWWQAAGIAQPTREQVAFGARYSVNGHFNNLVGAMRTAGLVEYPQGNAIALTDVGLHRADVGGQLARYGSTMATRADLKAQVLSVLRKEPLQRLFNAVYDAGGEVSREDLAEKTRYSVNGHFNNLVGRLRTLGLIEYPRGNHVVLGSLFDALPE